MQEVRDIRRMMERSRRFISLSGLSGVAAGLCALTGAILRNTIFNDYYFEYNHGSGYTDENFESLKIKLLALAGVVLAVALILSFILPGEEQNKAISSFGISLQEDYCGICLIPLIAGGLFILGMLQYNEWRFVAPACFIFYGLAW